MIAFILGIGAGDDEVGEFLGNLTAFRSANSSLNSQPIQTWLSASGAVRCHWVSHDAEALGGVTYTATREDQFSLITGRPIWWWDDRADGRTALDASSYLADPGTWSSRLDGRYAVVRTSGDTAQILTDPVGLQPIYESRRSGATWFTNFAPLVTRATDRVRDRALAAFLGTGEGTTGEPLSSEVTRVTPGTLVSIDGRGSRTQSPVNAITPEDFHYEMDFERASALLASACDAMSEWPKRPVVIGLTGGYDSRLVGAALRRNTIDATAVTIGFEDIPGSSDAEDVEIGSYVSGALGYSHSSISIDWRAPIYKDPAAVARFLRIASPGTVGLNDIREFGIPLPGASIPLLFEGVGGELARGSFDHQLGRAGSIFAGYRDTDSTAEMADSMFQRFIRPKPAPILNHDGIELIRSWMVDFVEDCVGAGFRLRDIPEVSFVRYTGTNFGSKAGMHDQRHEVLTPLMSRRLLPYILSQPRSDLHSGKFHRELTTRLGPDLVTIPYYSRSAQYGAGADAWPEYRKEKGLKPRITDQDKHGDPILGIQAAVREAVGDNPKNYAWDLLERDRVDELVSAKPQALDKGSRFQLWRLATIFLGDGLS